MSLLRRACPFLSTLLPIILAMVALTASSAARADAQDIAAASRSVVRVALVATDGESSYFVGHGSGVVVAPGRVLTNAHVVDLTRSEPNIVLGVIPSQGTNSYGGRVVAYSPGNDLALIAFDQRAKLPVATFYANAPVDGQQVTAIGYPGSVDRAQGMNLEDIIHPMNAVRTTGTVSTGRTSKQFDTVLHTAPLASGNSGGPLVDSCGRVLGINSFGSMSDGNDAEYGFAVSDREIVNFLRKAGVQPKQSIEPCKSLAEIEAAQQIADEQAKAQAAAQASQQAVAAREAAMAARERAQQAVIAQRENMMAFAALLLAGAALAGAGAILSHQRKGQRRLKLEVLAGILFVAAIAVFVMRPSFEGVDDADDAPIGNVMEPGDALAALSHGAVGDNLCRIDPRLSRVTISDAGDLLLRWSPQGCADDHTQMVQDGADWTHIMIPPDEAMIAVNHFDPATGVYRADKYLIDTMTAEKARTLRGGLGWSGCPADPARIAQLARVQEEVVALLPPQPNERLVYHCAANEAAAG